MKTYKSIINSFIIENDIRCIPDERGNVLFNLEDIIKALKIDINDFIHAITIICYTINKTDILFVSRKTMQFLISQSNTRYAREIYRSSGYKFKWFK